MNKILSHKYLKLLLLIITVLWFLIKSPFVFMLSIKDLGLDKSNPAVIDYHYLEFTSWILLFIPIFIYIFSKLDLKSFTNKYKFLILVFSNFFYALFRTFKTFDVTDTGFHFTKAWGLLHGSIEQNVDFWLGTSFINGLWLSIIGEPNLLWARFGYVLIVLGIALVSFRIYNLYFNRLKHFIVFLILSIFFIHFNYYLSVNYDNLPVLSAIIGIWFLLKPNKKFSSYIISGVFLSLTIWIKFNFIFIAVLPLVYAYLISEKTKKWLKPTLLIYSGYIITLVMGILLLATTDTLATYTKYLNKELINRKSTDSDYEKMYNKILNFGIKDKEIVDNNSITSEDKLFFLTDSLKNDSDRKEPHYLKQSDPHSLKMLFNTYFIDFWRVIKNGSIFSILFIILLLLLGNGKSLKHYATIILFSFLFFYSAFLSLEGRDYIFLSALIFPAYSYLVYYLKYKRNLLLPIMLILFVALFSFPGSNLSFNVIYRSGIGLLMISFPLAFMIDRKNIIDKVVFNLNNYVIIFILAITFSIIKPWGYNESHRDIGDRDLMIEMFKSPQLFGIHTFPQRIQVVDELLTYFNNEDYERNNTPSLFIGWIPMFYYLTETNCLANYPWHGCVPFDDFKDEFVMNYATIKPVYITISNKFTRNSSWPLADEEYKKRDKSWLSSLIQIDYIRYYIKNNAYQKTFENDMFEVYKLELNNKQDVENIMLIEDEKIK